MHAITESDFEIDAVFVDGIVDTVEEEVFEIFFPMALGPSSCAVSS